MQAPKNGFFYVLDRVTGEFISGKNYVNVTWTSGLDPKTGRPAMIPEARYLREPAMVAPGPVGAHNWYPMSYSPLTGLVYIPALESASYYKHDDKFEFRDRTWNTGLSAYARSREREDSRRRGARAAAALRSSRGIPCSSARRGAWPIRAPATAARCRPAASSCSRARSTAISTHTLRTTGAKLWSYDAQNAIMGGPMTFELDGEQYIATLAGIGGVAMGGALGGGGQKRSEFGRVVAFKLGGKAQLPALEETVTRVIPDLRRANATGDAEAGQRHYDRVCAACHGASARSATSVPDLRYSADDCRCGDVQVDRPRRRARGEGDGGIRFRAHAGGCGGGARLSRAHGACFGGSEVRVRLQPGLSRVSL